MKPIWMALSIAASLTLAHGQTITNLAPNTSGVPLLPAPCPPSKVWSVTNWGHFQRFTTSLFDWKTAVSPTVSVGLSRLAGIDDGFPRNWSGYAQHYGVNVLGNASGKFFANFAFPILFRQDEQFQRRGSTGFLSRLIHVGLHAVWAGQGLTSVNMSSLGGNAANSILANAYQPQSQRTIGATAQRFGLGMLLYVGGDAYTEFSPDARRALKKIASPIVSRMSSRSVPPPPPPKYADYWLLSPAQKKLAAEADWKSWDVSQQLQYLGGTQALANWCEFDQPCKKSLTARREPGLEQVNAVKGVTSAQKNAPSEDQYNIQVAWQPGADKCFDNAYGWGTHIAQLHKGMYGYDQNKWNDSFLGLVVLFYQNDSKKGQFHIGFGDGFDHYSADANSNIERNYQDYCGWYGPIDGFNQECKPAPRPPLVLSPEEALVASPPPVALSAAKGPLQPANTEERNRLQGTVQAFLNTLYVQADYAGLQQFVAQDNVFQRSAQGSETQWLNFFQAASKPSGTKLTSLKDAIAYRELTLPKGSQKLQYLNLKSANKLADPFAIINPASTPPGSYFPASKLPPEALQQLTARGRYFDHLRRTYQGRLYLVVYATKSPFVPEGVVLYWILQGSDWKLAAVQTTD